MLDQSKHNYISIFALSANAFEFNKIQDGFYIWAISTYFQMFFQLYCYCSRYLFKLQQILHGINRSSLEVFRKKAAFKIYAELPWKHLCWRLFFRKTCNSIRKRLQYRGFHVDFGAFLKNICGQLSLHLEYYTPANNTTEAVVE